MFFINKIHAALTGINRSITEEIQTNRILQGKLMAELNNKKTNVEALEEVEFKVFSQWGDDGIIQYLIQKLDIPNKTFVEFGVENYTESNTRFLLINNNWNGFIMDGSEIHMDYVKKDCIFWKYDLQCRAAFITAENVNELIASAGFDPEIGLLHIDIDGNDYWVWKAISGISPIIVIVEYNSLFGPENPWTTPYDPEFNRTIYHYSNLLYGSSLSSLCDLALEKGYDFIGCNSAGNNAYFIRKDKNRTLPAKTAKEGYVQSKFKESRDAAGNLTYFRTEERNNILTGQAVFDTRNYSLFHIK